MRALTLPSVLFTSALAGHAAADGGIPDASALVAVFVITVIAVAPFTAAPIRPARAVALLLLGQGLLHAALLLLDRTAVTATTTLCGADAGAAASAHSQPPPPMTHSDLAMSHGSVSLMGGGHLVMLLAHVAATIVVGVWLAAERAFWTVLDGCATGRGGVADAHECGPRHRGRRSRQLSTTAARLGLRCAVRGSVWTAGVVSRRGPPGAASPEPDAYAAASTV